MRDIYFDNSATTPPSERCIKEITQALSERYANPSSLHTKGYEARVAVEGAREKLLQTLGTNAQKHKLIFCASGSEANNLAILGCVRSKNRRFTPKLIIGEGEHPSVTAAARAAEREGCELAFVKTSGGEIDTSSLEAALDDRVVFCSIMMVNNETGALYDVKRAFSKVKAVSPECVCHCDCVQSYLKLPININTLGADMISISAHKIHGPKGIGALIVSCDVLKRRLLSPVIFGGGQEQSLRAGTENSAYILGFACAAEETRERMRDFYESAGLIYEYISDAIGSSPELAGYRINRPKNHVPYIISITGPRVKSETLLHFLSSEGIYVSSGSACSSHSKETSPALAAFGLDADEADRTIRVSLSRNNTLEEAEAFISALKKGAGTLVGYKKDK